MRAIIAVTDERMSFMALIHLKEQLPSSVQINVSSFFYLLPGLADMEYRCIHGASSRGKRRTWTPSYGEILCSVQHTSSRHIEIKTWGCSWAVFQVSKANKHDMYEPRTWNIDREQVIWYWIRLCPRLCAQLHSTNSQLAPIWLKTSLDIWKWAHGRDRFRVDICMAFRILNFQ